MIGGIGIDLVEISRIESVLGRRGERFITRCFSPPEISYCRQRIHAAPHYAARFAVKEAFLKCLGIGITGGVSMKDISVVRTERGKPQLQLTGTALAKMKARGMAAAHVSISHAGNYAAAIVTLEKGQDF